VLPSWAFVLLLTSARADAQKAQADHSAERKQLF
jgi:hypothetical protein